MTEIQYINSRESINKLEKELEKTHEVAVDLEFDNNLHHYGFKLCLMQLAFNDLVYLVDPIQTDIRPLLKFFENPKIRKVVFSFGEDLRILHSMGCIPMNLYDISTAAKLLNFEKISLSDVINEVLGFSLEKGEQMSNWSLRPLTESQMTYAARDVIYLSQLAEKMIQLTIEKQIDSWIEEENKSLEYVDKINSLANKIPTKQKRNMSEVEWHFYVRLWEFREELAKELDKPSHQVINNNFLIEIAQNPKLIEDWINLKYLHHKLKSFHYANELKKLRKSIEKEINEYQLSTERSAVASLSSEEVAQIKAKKRKIENIKENILKPVQELIRRDYGDFAVTHILSNRIMEEIADNDKTNFRHYRNQLLKKYIKELNLKANFDL
jgi:ribonuclease D